MAHAQIAVPARPTSPPLVNGDLLSRVEFDRRWEANPHIKKAELINGEVHLEMTVGANHAHAHKALMTFLGSFEALVGDCLALDNASVELGNDVVQPDALLLRRTDGTASVTNDIVKGPPELVCEVAASSASYDLHLKRDLYERAGVQEYLVWQVYENRIDWWQLVDGKYEALDLSEDGVFESKVFPGLRLHAIAMLTGDMAAVLSEVAPLSG